MSAPAPVTEAHRALALQIQLECAGEYDLDEPTTAQLIADSEAKACAELRAECNNLNNLLRAVGWGQGEIDSAACIEEENDQLRAEVERLKRDYDYDHKCLYEVRERCELWKQRAERAEAELDGIRALADRRNKRYHVEDTTHQLVAALDQALDIAQAELATERARLDWLEKRGPWESFNKWGETGISLRENVRAAIDAAMKEGRK